MKQRTSRSASTTRSTWGNGTMHVPYVIPPLQRKEVKQVQVVGPSPEVIHG